eukprot:COSAG01_NODE_3699_length_5782_cov_4.602147_2_plen_183_part_00
MTVSAGAAAPRGGGAPRRFVISWRQEARDFINLCTAELSPSRDAMHSGEWLQLPIAEDEPCRRRGALLSARACTTDTRTRRDRELLLLLLLAAGGCWLLLPAAACPPLRPALSHDTHRVLSLCVCARACFVRAWVRGAGWGHVGHGHRGAPGAQRLRLVVRPEGGADHRHRCHRRWRWWWQR